MRTVSRRDHGPGQRLGVDTMAYMSVVQFLSHASQFTGRRPLTRNSSTTTVGDSGDRPRRDDAVVVTVQDGVIDCGCECGKLQPRWWFKRAIGEPATTRMFELKNPYPSDRKNPAPWAPGQSAGCQRKEWWLARRQDGRPWAEGPRLAVRQAFSAHHRCSPVAGAMIGSGGPEARRSRWTCRGQPGGRRGPDRDATGLQGVGELTLQRDLQ